MKLLKKSWDLKSILLISVYDSIFLFLMYIMGQIFTQQMTVLAQSINAQDIKLAVAAGVSGKVTEQLELLRGVYSKFIFALILLVVTTIFIYTLFNIFIWAQVKKKKVDTEFIETFFKYTFPWNLVWGGVLVAFFFVYDPARLPLLVVGYSILFLYLTTCYHLSLISKKPVFKKLKEILSKSHYMIPFFICSLAILILILNILQVMQVPGIAFVVVSIPYLAWLRLVAYRFIKDYLTIK